MKAFYLLLALVPLTLASIRKPECQCSVAAKCPPHPVGCQCWNGYESFCAEECGRKPNLKICSTPSTTFIATSTPLPTRNPICATLSGIPCPDPRQPCVDNPFVENCLIAADCPGICIGPEICGGIAGIACPPGKVCLDDPTDDCDPKNGGFDCGGLCAIEEPFRSDLP